MADPLGIIGVIAIAVKIIKSAADLGLDWKDAPADAGKFVGEIQALKSVLSETNTNLLLSDDFRDAFHGQRSALLSQLGESVVETDTSAMVSACRIELETLLAELVKRAKGHQILSWERLKGTFLSKRTRETIENLHRQCQTLNGLMLTDIAALSVSTHKEIKEARRENQNWRADDYNQKVLEWLTTVNYGPEQSEFIGRRQEGTGNWLLESKQYQSWTHDTNKSILLRGIPGAGKTILTAIVVDDLLSRFRDEERIGVAFVYCDYRKSRDQKSSEVLMSILKQLAQSLSSLPEPVKSLYTKHKDAQTRPISSEISKTLQAVVACFSRVFIVVDALDEMNSGQDYRPQLLTDLFELQDEAGVNIFATSRFIPEIFAKFGRYTTTAVRFHAREDDIRKYLDGRITQCGRGLLISHREEVKDAITGAVQGMFLLARLYFDSISSMTTLRKVRDALKNLPTALDNWDLTYEQYMDHNMCSWDDLGNSLRGIDACDSAYDQVMDRIANSGAESENLAKQVLSWVVATKSITATELQQALAVEIGDSELDEDNLPRVEDMISVCMGLVSVYLVNGPISLVHYTAREYFQRTKDKWFPDAKADIAKTCLTYLSFNFDDKDTSIEENDFLSGWDPEKGEPFLSYAKACAIKHAHAASPEADAEFAAFLSSGSKTSIDCVWNEISWETTSTADWVLGHLVDINIRNNEFNTPFHQAVRNASKTQIKILLDRGAELTTNIRNMTPFHSAAGREEHELLQIFLDAGVPIDTRVRRWMWSKSEQDGVSCYVHKEDPHIPSHSSDVVRGLTALHFAALIGNSAMVKFLLDHGADPNAVSDYGETPLHLTISTHIQGRGKWTGDVQDEWEDVHLRIEHVPHRRPRDLDEYSYEVYDDCEDDSYYDFDEIDWEDRRKEKWPEVRKHREAILDLLIGHQAIKLDTRDAKGASPLDLACKRDDVYAVKALVKQGASVLNRDEEGRNALHHAAADYCSKNVVRALLDIAEANAEKEDLSKLISSRDKHGRNVLHYLVEQQFGPDLDLIRDTIRNGVCINDRDDKGNSPLLSLLKFYRCGYRGLADEVMATLVLYFLESGSDPSVVTFDEGLGVGHRCAMTENLTPELLSILERFGVDLCAQDVKGRTILHHAARARIMTETEIDDLARRTGLSKEVADKLGKTPSDYTAMLWEMIDGDTSLLCLGISFPDERDD